MKLIDESPDASGEAGCDVGHLNPGRIVHLSSLLTVGAGVQCLCQFSRS